MADVEKPAESKTESEATGAGKPAPKSTAKKKSAAKKKPASKKKAARKKVASGKGAAKQASSKGAVTATAAAGSKPIAREATASVPPASEAEQSAAPPPPPTAEVTEQAVPPPRPVSVQQTEPEPVAAPPPVPAEPPIHGTKVALALWGPMVIVGVLAFTLGDEKPAEDAATTAAPSPVVAETPLPSDVTAVEDPVSVKQAPAEPEAAAATGVALEERPLPAKTTSATAAESAGPADGSEPAADGKIAVPVDVTAERDTPLPVAPVSEVSESTPPASAMPGLAPPLPEPPPLAPVDERGATLPAFGSPYSASPPSTPGTGLGEAPPPTRAEPPAYSGPMAAPPGYYGQRQFERTPPPGFSSPLPLPGPGLYDPYAGLGPDEELQEPPPPSTAEDVWPERQVSPSGPRFQPYYAPPVPGHPSPYTFSPGRGPYGSYPYTR